MTETHHTTTHIYRGSGINMLSTILIYTGFILLIIAFIYELAYLLQPTKQKESKEDNKKYYLKLQNMTTEEILLFKNKEAFIKDVKCYDVLRNFYTDDQIINKCYPNYKRLD